MHGPAPGLQRVFPPASACLYADGYPNFIQKQDITKNVTSEGKAEFESQVPDRTRSYEAAQMKTNFNRNNKAMSPRKQKLSSNFAKLFCFGFAFAIFIYIVVNLSMVLGLLPIVGSPLPIMSYGGSSMLATMIGFGIVLSAKINHKQMIA